MLPELGPSLGKLAEPDESGRELPSALVAPLRAIRLSLVTEIFRAAARAREAVALHDPGGALAFLDRERWLRYWEGAAEGAARAVILEIDTRLREAASVARLPARRLSKVLVDSVEAKAIAGRLSGGAAPLFEAVDRLSRVPGPEWVAGVVTVARKLESAWLALEDAARRELEEWERDVVAVRAWRRPRWPLWLLSASVLGGAIYLGLVLGGYLIVPPWLEPIAQAVWSRW